MSLFEAGYFIPIQLYHTFLLDCIKCYKDKNFDILNDLKKITCLFVEEQYIDNYIKVSYYEYDLFLNFSLSLQIKPRLCEELFFLQFVQYQQSLLSLHLDDLQYKMSRPSTPIQSNTNLNNFDLENS